MYDFNVYTHGVMCLFDVYVFGLREVLSVVVEVCGVRKNWEGKAATEGLCIFIINIIVIINIVVIINITNIITIININIVNIIASLIKAATEGLCSDSFAYSTFL